MSGAAADPGDANFTARPGPMGGPLRPADRVRRDRGRTPGACLTAVAGVWAMQPAARETLHALLELHGLDRCIEVLRHHIA